MGSRRNKKRVITKHLAAHPEKKENALKDDDLAAIRDFIETLLDVVLIINVIEIQGHSCVLEFHLQGLFRGA